MDLENLNYIIQQFFIGTKVLNIDTINSGLINKTYVVDHLHNGRKSKFILQCLSNIFKSHEIVNINHKLITDHIKEKLNNNYPNVFPERWEVPSLIKCKSNNLYFFPFGTDFWRAMIYIKGTFCLDFLEDKKMAYQTGLGLAKFHLFCSDLDSSKLKNSIRNFHNTNYYLEQYISTLNNYNFMKSEDQLKKRTQELIYRLSNHIGYVKFLLKSLNFKSLDKNVIHGDPKLSNFLFDNRYKNVVSLIDLDTVCSGFFLTDLADCIRSICNLVGEDPEDPDNVFFDINYCKYLLNGYFSIAEQKNNYSFKLLPEFIYLIIFELTIRFLTDFLQSNRYFKIKYETHNLFRAEVQYRLLSSFLNQIPTISHELQEVGISSCSTFVSYVQKIV